MRAGPAPHGPHALPTPTDATANRGGHETGLYWPLRSRTNALPEPLAAPVDARPTAREHHGKLGAARAGAFTFRVVNMRRPVCVCQALIYKILCPSFRSVARGRVNRPNRNVFCQMRDLRGRRRQTARSYRRTAGWRRGRRPFRPASARRRGSSLAAPAPPASMNCLRRVVLGLAVGAEASIRRRCSGPSVACASCASHLLLRPRRAVVQRGLQRRGRRRHGRLRRLGRRRLGLRALRGLGGLRCRSRVGRGLRPRAASVLRRRPGRRAAFPRRAAPARAARRRGAAAAARRAATAARAASSRRGLTQPLAAEHARSRATQESRRAHGCD